MNYKHKDLAAGRWKQLPFLEQMANIGSEVERALNWRKKNDFIRSQQAFERALELLDFTLDSLKTYPRIKEATRLREALVDYFSGTDQSMTDEESWRKYFFHFTYAARRNR